MDVALAAELDKCHAAALALLGSEHAHLAKAGAMAVVVKEVGMEAVVTARHW